MISASDRQRIDSVMVTEFLMKTVPFNELDNDKLDELAQKFSTTFFSKETVVFCQDVDKVDHFYLIYSGGVKAYLTGADESVTLLDFRGEGGYFGALAIIRGSKANFNVETLEDTICLGLDKEDFLELIRNNPRFSEYYLKKFSEDLVSTAYAELRFSKARARARETLPLFSSEVGEVIKRPPEVIHASQSIQQAARRMSDLEIGSLLVEDQSGKIAGIVTDKDLRKKVIAEGLDYHAPVATVMSAPLKKIPYHLLWFDALLHMMKERVYHLAVERGNHIVGVVSVRDFMVQTGSSPLYLFREIDNQRSIEGLYPLAQRIPRVVTALVEEGARANNITRVITVLNDQVVHRLLTLLDDQMGPAPFPYCWFTFGSEGRKEQTFKTDQDNALIYEPPSETEENIKNARIFFRRFGMEANRHLGACGFELCKGKMMVSNPRWRKSYREWEAYFNQWMALPEPEEVLNASIFFDFRPVYGQTELGENLRNYLAAEVPSREVFLLFLAKDFLVSRSPLTFFRNFMVEKDGKYKNRLDLKTQGMTPFVNFARLWALRNGIKETNTMERIEILAKNGFMPKALHMETRDAYEFQMQLRLVNQLRMMDANQEPHNYIDPADLSHVEKQTLKESFSVIGRLQDYVKSEMRALE